MLCCCWLRSSISIAHPKRDLERFGEGREIGRLGEERGGRKGWKESFQIVFFFNPGEKGDWLIGLEVR